MLKLTNIIQFYVKHSVIYLTFNKLKMMYESVLRLRKCSFRLLFSRGRFAPDKWLPFAHPLQRNWCRQITLFPFLFCIYKLPPSVLLTFHFVPLLYACVCDCVQGACCLLYTSMGNSDKERDPTTFNQSYTMSLRSE